MLGKRLHAEEFGAELDFEQYFSEIRRLIDSGPGANKRAYARILAIRRTFYVAATTEEQCRLISAMVRLIRRWFSEESIPETEVMTRRAAVVSVVDALSRSLTAR